MRFLSFIFIFLISFTSAKKNNCISEQEELNEVLLLKKSFIDGDWFAKYVKGYSTRIMVEYCQKAYKSYLKDLIMIRLFELNEVSEKTLQNQLDNTSHKCKLCLASIKIASDNKFIQEHWIKFILKNDQKKLNHA
ncbi:hypothetical protein [Candidatus Cytomitobacter primus]|uniref:Uncharacterized protein n=1 Tax=Candidatus Cytomitobacter primus TaxID=2066024 RepID=A0A5C0UES4_9PROT|nr:hypothetical protein [Candidatus Cytomitobacter primus]QEK38548.1 hypothetical protein FZC34_01325 [Candidatus Cytomitobacter primus]